MAKFTSDTARSAAKKANAVLNAKGTRHRFNSDTAKKAHSKRYGTTLVENVNVSPPVEKVSPLQAQ
jgi:hypothetical protein